MFGFKKKKIEKPIQILEKYQVRIFYTDGTKALSECEGYSKPEALQNIAIGLHRGDYTMYVDIDTSSIIPKTVERVQLLNKFIRS